jgi:hypothetical protein
MYNSKAAAKNGIESVQKIVGTRSGMKRKTLRMGISILM